MLPNSVREATVVIPRRNHEILLPRILRGHCKGYYAGPGGKCEPEETPEQCACREIHEEIGIIVKESNLQPFGICDDIHFNGTHQWQWRVYFFWVGAWEGTAMPTEEADPRGCWFNTNRLPWNKMYPTYHRFLPEVLHRGESRITVISTSRNKFSQTLSGLAEEHLSHLRTQTHQG